MRTLELTDEEQEVLSLVVQNALATIELEILHTDHAEFKALLKQRRKLLQGLADRLQSSVVGAS